MSTLQGVGVSPGEAAGPVLWVRDRLPDPAPGPAPADPAAEAARIRPAAEAVAQRLLARSEAATGEARAVLEMTAAMAADPALLGNAEKAVAQRGLPAPRAVFEAAGEFAELLAASGGYLAERVRDVHDVRDRLVAELTGTAPPGVPELTGPAVLVARDLAPADTADLDPGLVLALVTEEGGPTSHTAILARALGIPAVVAVRGVLSAAAAGARVDGAAGTVELLEQAVAPESADRAGARWHGSGSTADGHPIKLLANIGSAADARAGVDAGAEGSGLFRTEFCFLDAAVEPDAETQRQAYAAALRPFAGKPVVVRTLDAGADKPLPFLDIADEPNPALGVRGLRVAFDRPELLDRQLTAIVAAAAETGAVVSVMAPMVATAGEAAWFAERARDAGVERVGVMVETPAAALCADEILDVVDFVSIGTNDLAQYTCAADRMTGALAALNDPWQPALLRLIAGLGRAGRERGKPVGVCGEAAADPLLAGVLAGLGVTSLSMTATALAAVGAALAERTLSDWQDAARQAVAAPDPAEARSRAGRSLERG
ncbi:phosphoenolpyruvate--protein phosphotransferase [Saccharopolyspora shandongensis]|uniref:Phosphoenolpyruvate-protein phosphotransferase n=1 Tax=Saccharopolyspora shandongensis TaxID=418495 RepID=A0A1H2QKH2_9PSEU|nr:putative PEP-binding protein [Saccharopolyspora shandongensis]SDW07672.1 phosphoenolpyruvate--protein phosphotransferase [Saccharopolyspora shandongensis]